MDIKEKLNKLPTNPGVYIMKEATGQVIYVGKANSIRKRVRQYFQNNVKSQRIINMVNLINDIDYIVTENEVEALVLECNLIKQYMPKFNVLLKDDKSYPYIKVSVNEKYPSITIARQIKKDGAKYYGPYPNKGAVHDILRIVRQLFPIKKCKHDLNRKKLKAPCLYYHIGKCLGPCTNEISMDDYNKLISQVCLFLEGKDDEIISILKQQIDEYSKQLKFEQAKILRDRMLNIQVLRDKQKVSNINETDFDVIGFVAQLGNVFVQVFNVRNSKVVNREQFQVAINDNVVADVLSSFITQYYTDRYIPSKIYVKDEPEGINLIEEYLNSKKGASVEVKVVKKGQKKKLVDMVEENINISLKEKEQPLSILVSELGIEEDINSIEAYDISNLSGDFVVGCMIRYENNKLQKNMYRKFKIKTVNGQNDPACMSEIINRRINHKEWELPDIILLDGGITQINAVKKVLLNNQIDIHIFGMVKDDKHKTKGLLDCSGKEVKITNKKVLHFITFIQDEVHRFTIRYHRSLRDKIKKSK